MSDHNLRYFGLAALTGLTALGWFLDKLTPEITAAVFIALGGLVGLDMYKARKGKG